MASTPRFVIGRPSVINFSREVAEAALAHVVRTEAAYRRGDLFEKRRRLMDAWAAQCAVAETNVAAGPVTPFKRAEA
jgi:hypothetical protein